MTQLAEMERSLRGMAELLGIDFDTALRNAIEPFGGEGSGNFGHAGRPGEVGGSGPGGAEAGEFLRRVNENPKVIKARERLKSQPQTANKYQRHDGSYVPERAKLHDEIVSSMLNAKAKSDSPRLAMLLGIPASGKTKVLRKEVEGEYTVIDADTIKAKLPEYSGENAGAVHKESGHIAETKLLPRAIAERHNVMLDWTGKNTQKSVYVAEQARKAGYQVDVYFVDVKPIEAAKRSLKRFEEEGRFVDPEYIVNAIGNNPSKTYAALKESGLISKYKKFDNNVPFGSPARLVEESK